MSDSQFNANEFNLRLALYREFSADWRHAQQLFQNTLTLYIATLAGLLAGRDRLQTLFLGPNPILTMLSVIPIILTFFAYRHAKSSEDAIKEARYQQKKLADQQVSIELLVVPRSEIVTNPYWVRPFSSRVAIVSFMGVLDLACLVYLNFHFAF